MAMPWRLLNTAFILSAYPATVTQAETPTLKRKKGAMPQKLFSMKRRFRLISAVMRPVEISRPACAQRMSAKSTAPAVKPHR